MSLKRSPRLLLLVPFALAASAHCFAADSPTSVPHNLILFVPEVLPAAGVDLATTPALARLRSEGVNFINSHSSFPRLTQSDPAPLTADFNAASLIAAADAALSQEGRKRYSTALVDDSHVGPDSPQTALDSVLTVLLPQFKEAGRPFILVYRMGERADTSDDTGSASTTTADFPWIANVRAADGALAAIEDALKSLGLYDSTNIIVSAEHGVSRIWKASGTSPSLKVASDVRPPDELPPGFLAIDLISVLQEEDPRLSLFDPDNGNRRLDWQIGEFPETGNAIIAADPSDPDLLIEAYGGHDALFLTQNITKQEARRMGATLAETLLTHDYVSGIFVDEDRIGRVRGALSMKHLVPDGRTRTRGPDIVVSFASANIGCDRPTVCTALIADTPLEVGDAIHGSFNRADTWNFMAVRGPDFQSRYVSRAPASNADIGRTVAELTGVERQIGKKTAARVLTESLRNYAGKGPPTVREYVIDSKPSTDDELITEVRGQAVGSTLYFDAAGFPGWTVGLKEQPARIRWHWPEWRWPFRMFTIAITPD